jgi:cell division protein FtsA
LAEAERIKTRFGCARTALVKKDETIEIAGLGGRKARILSRQILAEILEPRVEEIFTLIQREMVRSGFADTVTAGVVITGGSAMLPGVAEVAEDVFNLPARIGYPLGIGGLTDVVNSPRYATSVGLVLYGMRHEPKRKFRIRDQNIFGRVVGRMKGWFAEVM